MKERQDRLNPTAICGVVEKVARLVSHTNDTMQLRFDHSSMASSAFAPASKRIDSSTTHVPAPI